MPDAIDVNLSIPRDLGKLGAAELGSIAQLAASSTFSLRR